MHTLVKMPSALAVLAFAILRAQAANVINELSFGLHHEVSKDGRSVPGWRLGGHDRRTPEVYSDRITLTPPYPGNLRTSLWTERTVQTAEWTADVEFRASGPERGSGNLQIWYAKDGEKEVGSASMYTIGQFDGLVLVVDQYGGHGGSIRGFLNDGTKSFKDHHQVDTLAFGHCDFAYRNLGHFTHLSMRQSRDEFSVEVEGHPCFKTHKVSSCDCGARLALTISSGQDALGLQLWDISRIGRESRLFRAEPIHCRRWYYRCWPLSPLWRQAATSDGLSSRFFSSPSSARWLSLRRRVARHAGFRLPHLG